MSNRNSHFGVGASLGGSLNHDIHATRSHASLYNNDDAPPHGIPRPELPLEEDDAPPHGIPRPQLPPDEVHRAGGPGALPPDRYPPRGINDTQPIPITKREDNT